MTVVEAIVPQIFEDFTDIKNHYDVTDEDFTRAVRFCLGFTSSETRAEAYLKIFPDTSQRDAGKLSAWYIKKKYVDDILSRMYSTNNLMYSDKRNIVIQEMSRVAMADGDDIGYRNKIDAAKVFLENTKMPESIVIDHKFEVDDKSVKAMESFMGVMEAISQGKVGMLGRDGEIIDVEEIE